MIKKRVQALLEDAECDIWFFSAALFLLVFLLFSLNRGWIGSL